MESPQTTGRTLAGGDAPVSPAGASAFLDLMSAFPSGVAIVTATAVDGTPRGLTCSSLCSVTAKPPTLLVCVHNRSGTLAAMLERELFAVNLLHGAARGVAEVFASGRADRFDAVAWRFTPRFNLPGLVFDAHAIAECRMSAAHVVGDHTMVLGHPLTIATTTAPPLLYGLRRFDIWPA